ncbi:MAG: nucleotidyltransferase domain-containing protein [Holosporales bacterium]|jgi:predicted nucleotidyltransferase
MMQLDPPLQQFRSAIEQHYGDNIQRLVLFGSRARGEATDDSDYDLALFLRNFSDRWREKAFILPIELKIMDETGAVLNTIPFAENAFEQRTPLMYAIRSEGIDI